MKLKTPTQKKEWESTRPHRMGKQDVVLARIEAAQKAASEARGRA